MNWWIEKIVYRFSSIATVISSRSSSYMSLTVQEIKSQYVCVCLTDGSRAHKEEPVKMKNKASSYHHIGGQPLKTFSPLVETKYILCQTIITINISNITVPWNQPPPHSLMPPYSAFTSLFLLLSLLLSCRSLLCHWYGLAVFCHCYRTMTQRLPWRPRWYHSVWRKLGTRSFVARFV